MFRKFCFFFCMGISFLCSDSSIDLSTFETSLYSENGEDGVLAKIFQLIPPSSRYCVDLGASDGITMSNTYLLRLQGWDCLLLDRAHEIADYKLHKEFITAENINRLFEAYRVPSNFGLLSIDVDYNDFHLWNALDPKYNPSVVVVQYNATYSDKEDKVVKYHPFYCGDGTDYFGASILAFYNLGKAKGYSLIYAEKSGRNLFFIRNDLLGDIAFKNMNDVSAIYRPPSYLVTHRDEKNRTFTSSHDCMR